MVFWEVFSVVPLFFPPRHLYSFWPMVLFYKVISRYVSVIINSLLEKAIRYEFALTTQHIGVSEI